MNQSIPLWKLGLGLIIGGVASGVVLGSADVSTAAGRGQAFGRGLAQLVFVAAGIILIAIHFLKRAKKSKDS